MRLPFEQIGQLRHVRHDALRLVIRSNGLSLACDKFTTMTGIISYPATFATGLIVGVAQWSQHTSESACHPANVG